MPARELLEDLETCIRNNQYGSHDDQAALLRAEIMSRITG